MNSKECSGVIFDLDGTLIDTEAHHCRCWKEAGRSFGYELEQEDILSLRSLDEGLAKEMLERNYPGLDFDKTKKARKKLMAEHIDRYGIELKPGAKEILKYLTMKRIPAMVATATEYELAEKCLMEVGLYDDLERIISASQIERGKPFPDIYKYACRTIDADPSNCYAVEDSLNGVRSAVAAGCNTIMVPDDVMPDVDLKKQLVLVTDSLINLILYFNKVL